MGNVFTVKPLPKDAVERIESQIDDLQSQINGVVAGQNLADIVANLTALNALDVSDLDSGDKVQVLVDADHDDGSTVYNLVKTDNNHYWVYIGKYGQDSYTKAESNALLAQKQDVIDSEHKLSADLISENSNKQFVTESEKEQITTNANSIMSIKNGSSISSFGDVESALAQKQNKIDSNNKLSSGLVDDSGSDNKFVSASEKSQITTNANDIAGIKDGTTIDSFADVETAINTMFTITGGTWDE